MSQSFANTLCTLIWASTLAVIAYLAYAINLLPALAHLFGL